MLLKSIVDSYILVAEAISLGAEETDVLANQGTCSCRKRTYLRSPGVQQPAQSPVSMSSTHQLPISHQQHDHLFMPGEEAKNQYLGS